MTLLSILLTGFLLGLKHASEPDHLAAVATLVTRRSTTACALLQGFAWGVGHAVTLVVFGGLVLALGTAVPRRIELALELAVALMLVALGADALRRLAWRPIRFRFHRHGRQRRHGHAHSRAGDAQAPRRMHPGSTHADEAHEHRHGLPLRALVVGTMHVAGSAALVLLSPGPARSWAPGLAYIALFGLGSIAGMAGLSLAIAVPPRLAVGRLEAVHAPTTAVTGAFSCTLGGDLVYEIGPVRGLLHG
jgi:hypothetical protein